MIDEDCTTELLKLKSPILAIFSWYNELMDVNTIVLIITLVLIIAGIAIRGNAKKNTAVGVTSTMLITLGVIGVIYLLAQWLPGLFKGWSDYADKYR